MTPTALSENLWNSLVTGGETSTKAIADFAAMPDIKRAVVLEQLFQRAERFIDTLIATEGKCSRAEFREQKRKLLTVLDALPSLTTEESKVTAVARLTNIDERSRPLTDIDIGMKCDEVIKALRAPTLSDLKAPEMITCGSIEELEKHIGGPIPPELAEKIKKEGGAIIVGVTVTKVKK